MIAAIHGILEQGGINLGEPVSFSYISAGMTVSGGVITKTSGGASWNASVASDNLVASGQTAEVIFRIHTLGRFMIGFSNGRETDSFNTIDFALYIDSASGNVANYENGANPSGAFARAAAVGEYYKVRISATNVSYYYSTNAGESWTLIRATAKTPVFPLLVDSAFYDVGGAVNNVTIKYL